MIATVIQLASFSGHHKMFQCPNCETRVFETACTKCGRRDPASISNDSTDFDAYLRECKIAHLTPVTQKPRIEPPPPLPFRKRLAGFLDRREDEVMLDHPDDSSMLFRLFAPLGNYAGPKSAKIIAALLRNIARLVHGRDQG